MVSLEEFFIDIKSFRSHYGPGVDSASNRNEYQEHFLGSKGGRCVRLRTYHHPVPLSWNLGTLTSWNPLGHSRPVTGLLYLLVIIHTTCLWRWNRKSVPKRRHIKFRRRGITQKKAYNIQNKAKVWNQESFFLIWSPSQYLASSTVHKAPSYVVFSTPVRKLSTADDLWLFHKGYARNIILSDNCRCVTAAHLTKTRGPRLASNRKSGKRLQGALLWCFAWFWSVTANKRRDTTT